MFGPILAQAHPYDVVHPSSLCCHKECIHIIIISIVVLPSFTKFKLIVQHNYVDLQKVAAVGPLCGNWACYYLVPPCGQQD